METKINVDSKVDAIEGLSPSDGHDVCRHSATNVGLSLQDGSDDNLAKDPLSLLHACANDYDVKVIEKLLNSGENIRAKSSNGNTALHYAVEHNSEQLVELLLRYEPDVDAENDRGMTPLHVGTKGNCAKVVEMLLDHRADVNAVDEQGWSPLVIGVYMNYVTVSKTLLDRGADMSALLPNGDSILLYAVKSNSIQMVKLLLEYKANVQRRDAQGWPPVLICIRLDYIKTAEVLLNWGADVHATWFFEDKTALQYAVEKNSLEWVRLLLHYGADITNLGDTFIIRCAFKKEHHQIAKLFLEYGAIVEAPSNNGWTPLVVSVTTENLAFMKTLLDFRADVNGKLPYNGATALHGAVHANLLECVKLLLYHGADINIRNNANQTAIDIAFEQNHHSVLEEIIKRHCINNNVLSLHINERDMKRIQKCPELRTFKTKCEQEIEVMQGKVGNSTVSYYDMATKGAKHLVICVGNENIVQELSRETYKDMFPIYADMIHENFSEAKERNELLKSCWPCIFHLFHCELNRSLPYSFVNSVLRHLNNGDLNTLMTSCSNVGI